MIYIQVIFSTHYTDSIPVKRSGFGSGSGMIVLDDLDCSGSESSLVDCPSDSSVLINDCNHTEDAGVRCLCEILNKSFRL